MCPSGAEPLLVVVVDDDQSHLRLIRGTLEFAYGEDGIEVRTYTKAHEALADLPAHRMAVILCDIVLGDATGLDWLPDFVRSDVGPVILVTSSGDESIAAESFRKGAIDYIEKSKIIQNPDRLKQALVEAIRKFELVNANKELANKLKLMNRQLEQNNRTLEQLTNTAHRFVEDVAHEFRTPLAVIREFAAIMKDGIGGRVTPKHDEFLGYISEATSDLAHLIDDFLDSSKIRARTLRVERERHAVHELIEAVWPILETRAKAKHIVLHRDLAPGLPDVYADSDKLRRTLINLVVNAIKFSNSNDTVVISARLGEQGMVEISVIDEGPGLPEEQAKRLFQRFRQAEIGEQCDCEGFGLGLSIVKELVAINLGRVRVESIYGEGSTFSFTVPPNSPAVVLDAYLAGCRDRDSTGHISVLWGCIEPVTVTATKHAAMLSSLCYPGDLVLASGEEPGCLIIGECPQAELWQSRLIERFKSKSEFGTNQNSPSLRVECLGTWHLQHAHDRIMQLITPEQEAPARV